MNFKHDSYLAFVSAVKTDSLILSAVPLWQYNEFGAELELGVEEFCEAIRRFKNFTFEYRLPKSGRLFSNSSEGDWYKIFLTREQNAHALVELLESGDDELEGFIASEDKVAEEEAYSRLSLRHFQGRSEDEIRNLFKGISLKNILLEAKNVGQGSCAELLEYPSWYVERFYKKDQLFRFVADVKTSILFDAGGGLNNKTFFYPNLSVRKNETIVILSHWHKDHWNLIDKYKNEDLAELKWLVPDQKLSAAALQVVARLYKKRNLYLWKLRGNNEEVIDMGDIILCKLPHSNINNSGIVASLRVNGCCHNGQVLIPGDASLNKIPQMMRNDLVSLIAPHHGGSGSEYNDIPLAKGCSKVVYSYGIHNSYNHPNKRVKADYFKKGWNNSMFTSTGDVTVYPCYKKVLLSEQIPLDLS